VIAAWMVGILATIALSLQDFSLSYTLTGGGPLNATTTLAMFQFRQAFQFYRFGVSAALSVLLLAALMLCGLAAGAALVFSGLRLSFVSRVADRTPPGSSKAVPLLVLILILLCLLPACVLGLLPNLWVARLGLRPLVGEVLLESFPWVRVLTNTFLPLTLSVFLVQLPIAYAGALGIGALRPLGRWSEMLLLPFTPWLFVTILPVSLPAFLRLLEYGGMNRLLSLPPPLWLNVPMLVILTLFFKGQQAAWEEAQARGKAGTFFSQVILPSLPLALLLGAAALFFSAGDLYWPLIVANQPDRFTVPVALAWLHGQYAMNGRLMASVLIRLMLPITVGFFIVFAVFQVFYLDHLSASREQPQE
jgi:hypothetical protein